MKALISGFVSALIFWIVLFSCFATCGQTLIWNSSMSIPLKHGGDTLVNDSTATLLFAVEAVPGYKYIIQMETLPTELIIPGSKYEAAQGITTQGDVVGNIDRDDWIMYYLDLTGAKTTLWYEYALADNTPGLVEFRLTSNSAPIIATIALPVTGGWDKFKKIQIPFVLNKGTHSLFLTFKGSPRQYGAGGNLKSLTLK